MVRNMDIQVLKPPTLRIDDLLDVTIDPSSLLVKRPISIGTEHLDEVKFTALLIVIILLLCSSSTDQNT